MSLADILHLAQTGLAKIDPGISDIVHTQQLENGLLNTASL